AHRDVRRDRRNARLLGEVQDLLARELRRGAADRGELLPEADRKARVQDRLGSDLPPDRVGAVAWGALNDDRKRRVRRRLRLGDEISGDERRRRRPGGRAGGRRAERQREREQDDSERAERESSRDRDEPHLTPSCRRGRNERTL